MDPFNSNFMKNLLMEALEHKEENVLITEILNSGIEVKDVRDCEGNSPLMMAIINSYSIETVSEILKHDTSAIMDRNSCGNTVFHSCENTELLQFLINQVSIVNAENFTDLKCNFDVNVKNNDDETPLIYALINYKSVRFVNKLLENGADPNIPDLSMNSAMFDATEEDEFDSLSSYNASINATDVQGITPLIYACYFDDNLEIVKCLLKNGADPNYYSRDNNTALHFATDIRVMKLLLDFGADINIKNNFDETPLLELCKKKPDNLFEIVIFLVLNGADPNCIDSEKNTPLHYIEDFNTIKFMLEHNADINIKNLCNETPLFAYCKSCKSGVKNAKEVVELYLNHGADPNWSSRHGNILLHHCLADLQTVKLLLESGASVNKRNHSIESPLLALCKYHGRGINIDILKLLLDYGASPDCFDSVKNTPLHYVRHFETIKVLLEYGADVNMKNRFNETPMLMYCKNDYNRLRYPSINKVYLSAAVVTLFLNYGADPNSFDTNMNTALHYVRDFEIIKLLLDHGANVKMKNCYNQTPLIMYCKKQNKFDCVLDTVVKLLLDNYVDINCLDFQNNNALWYAHHCGTVIYLLLWYGAYFNTNKSLSEMLLSTQSNGQRYVEDRSVFDTEIGFIQDRNYYSGLLLKIKFMLLSKNSNLYINEIQHELPSIFSNGHFWKNLLGEVIKLDAYYVKKDISLYYACKNIERLTYEDIIMIYHDLYKQLEIHKKFPLFCETIVFKFQLFIRKCNLFKNLGHLTITADCVHENNIDNNFADLMSNDFKSCRNYNNKANNKVVVLKYDCLYYIAKNYLNLSEIYNLYLASMKNHDNVTQNSVECKTPDIKYE